MYILIMPTLRKKSENDERMRVTDRRYLRIGPRRNIIYIDLPILLVQGNPLKLRLSLEDSPRIRYHPSRGSSCDVMFPDVGRR